VQLNPPPSPPLILPFLKGVPGFSRGRDLIRKGGIKVKCKEPLFRLRSDEMDNRVTHFASSLVVIKVKCKEPLFRLRSDEMDNRVTHFASSLVVIMSKGNSHMFLNLCISHKRPYRNLAINRTINHLINLISIAMCEHA